MHLDRGAGVAEEPAILRDAIAKFFAYRAQVTMQRLHQLLRIGRTSLIIGLVFLIAAVSLGDLFGTLIQGPRLGELLREGLSIGGWVAMWRPLEIFLYGWWPIRAEARLYRRLSAMPVRITYKGDAEPGAWRSDWPAVSQVKQAPNPTASSVSPASATSMEK